MGMGASINFAMRTCRPRSRGWRGSGDSRDERKPSRLENTEELSEGCNAAPVSGHPWTRRCGRRAAPAAFSNTCPKPLGSPRGDVYVCGLKEMVDQVRALLKGWDFDRKQIIFEKCD